MSETRWVKNFHFLVMKNVGPCALHSFSSEKSFCSTSLDETHVSSGNFPDHRPTNVPVALDV